MANLFISRSFHCFWLPFPNLPPKPSTSLQFPTPISFPRRWSTINSNHHIHVVSNSTSSSTSVPEEDDDIHIISSTQCSDGSFIFKFGNASEIREHIGVEKLRNEDDCKLGEEIESSSIEIVGVADQNSQLLVTEEESSVLDSDLETPVVNDSQKNDRHMKLGSVEDGDGQNGIFGEDVAAESVYEENSQIESHKEVVVSTVSPDSGVLSDLSNGASGYEEVEEKEEVDKGHGVDTAAASLTGAVDADPGELVPVSNSLESENSVDRATNNLTGCVDAEMSELVRVSTSLESEQVDIGTTDNLTGSADAETSELVRVSTSLESEQVDNSTTGTLTGSVDAEISELVRVSTSLESEQVDNGTADNLTGTGSVDAKISELVPICTSLESEQVDNSATDNLTGSSDADISELVPASTCLETEQVDYGSTKNLTGSAEAETGEFVPVSTSLDSEQVNRSAEDNLTGSADAYTSELFPVSTSLESVQVDCSAADSLTESAGAEIGELVPVSTLESEPAGDCTTDDLTGSADASTSELLPVSTSLETTQVDCRAADNLTESVDAEISESVPVSTLESTGSVGADISEPIPVPTPLEIEQVDNSATEDLTGSADADISELVPVSTLLESEQCANGATNHLTAGDDALLSKEVPVSTPVKSEQVDNSAIDDQTGQVDADLIESVAPVSTPFESELHANDKETAHHIVDGSFDASKIEKSATLQDLVPSPDLENKIDVGNTEISDYENLSNITVPETDSVEGAGHGEKASRTELFLVSGAACLAHPSKALTVREDAYFISGKNWLAVADGVGQWSLEGSNTGLYIRELMENCENIVSNCENISTIKPAEVLTRSVTETQTPGSSSILVAHFDGQNLHAANVGNTGFLIIRDGSIFKKSNARFHEFSFPLQIVKDDDHSDIIEEYKIDLNNDDVIVFATNGLFDNLYEQEIASSVSKLLQASLRPQDIAEFLAIRAQEVGRSRTTRSPFGDAAQAVGYVGYAGGKLDDVTVIVSLVQTR